jgi:hypothetical protein
MEADKEEGDQIPSLGPYDSNGLADTGFKDLVGTFGMEGFDPKAVRCLTSCGVGADLAIRFSDKRLFLKGEAVEAL